MNKIKHKPEIFAYLHCKTCMSGQLAVGWTEKGLQIFCDDCQLNVCHLDFKGQKVGIVKPKEDKD